MADALCGPSNALQNFQKHTTVDRTLQQDRLTSRHSPAQGFRSSPGPNAGILDPEFDAFQAGHASPLQPDLRFPPQQTFVPQFVQATQAPGWASDFQRLNINASQPPPILQPHAPQASNAAASWHQDFLRQQTPVAQTSTPQAGLYGGMAMPLTGWEAPVFQQRPGYGAMGGTPMSETALRKQRAQEAVPELEEAAFEKAFAQAQQDALEHANIQAQVNIAQDSSPIETGPTLLRIREKRLPVYTVIKLRSEIDLGRHAEAIPWLDDLQQLERSGRLTEDVSEARWCVDALRKIIDREAPADIKTRAERLITAINERLMSSYPLLSSNIPVNLDSVREDLEAAGYVESPIPERVGQQSEQQKGEHPIQHDHDELAATAGTLLERVADNTSEKFQNSQFLELMRRLRDREVRVEGDKVVEVSAQSQSSASPLAATSAPPQVDPNILSHFAQDFGIPIDSEQELGLSRHSTNEYTTDEISEQFSYYNINAQYHR